MRTLKNFIIYFVVFLNVFCFSILSANASDDNIAAMQLLDGSVKDGDINVYPETKNIIFEFSNDINETNGVIIKKNGVVVDYEKEVVNSRFLKIILESELGYDAECTINLTNVSDISGNKCDTIMYFTTENSPDIIVADCTISDALGVLGVDFTFQNSAEENKKAYITVVISGENKVVKDISELVIGVPADEKTRFQTGYYCNPSWGRCSFQIMIRDENEMPVWNTIVLCDD